MTTQTPSKSLVKRASPSTDIIVASSSQPPVKRIKRPTEVLEEEDYEAGIEHIIRRDFFPGLAETEAKRQYLLALESADDDWIFEAKTRLRAVQAAAASRTGPRRQEEEGRPDDSGTPALGLRATASDTPRHWRGGETPRTVAGNQTPSSVSQREGEQGTSKIDTSLGLSAFQHKYTSEDNESFYKLLDKSNAARAEKHAYLWSNTNKLATPRQLEEARRKQLLTDARTQETVVNGRELARIEMPDERPAAPDTWRAKPNNAFMFAPDSVEDTHGSEQQRRESRSRMGEKSIVVENTRMPPPPMKPRKRDEGAVPESPSLSAVRAAVHGRPRLSASMAGSTVGDGASTPRVNGWAFVDSEDPEPEPVYVRRRPGRNDDDDDDDDDKIDLGPGDATPNPFRIRNEPAREALHDRMLDRMNKNKLDKRLDGLKSGTPVPKFTSSPRVVRDAMSPAARRLLSSFTPGGKGTGAAEGNSRRTGSTLGDAWGSSPLGAERRGTPKEKMGLAGVTPVRKAT